MQNAAFDPVEPSLEGVPAFGGRPAVDYNIESDGGHLPTAALLM
jgi:hypothetical protein